MVAPGGFEPPRQGSKPLMLPLHQGAVLWTTEVDSHNSLGICSPAPKLLGHRWHACCCGGESAFRPRMCFATLAFQASAFAILPSLHCGGWSRSRSCMRLAAPGFEPGPFASSGIHPLELCNGGDGEIRTRVGAFAPTTA